MEEVLIEFASEDEEPGLRDWYVPNHTPGHHGKTMLKLYGRTSFLPIKGERLFSLDEKTIATRRWKELHDTWEKRQLANKLRSLQQQAKKPVRK